MDCPCGGMTWTGGAPDGARCTKCGRIYRIWSNAKPAWIPDPTVEAVNRLYHDGQQHFESLHREVRILKRIVKELKKAVEGKKAKP